MYTKEEQKSKKGRRNRVVGLFSLSGKTSLVIVVQQVVQRVVKGHRGTSINISLGWSDLGS